MPKCIKNTWIFILFCFSAFPILAQNLQDVIKIKVTDYDSIPIFGVYIVQKQQNILLASTDIDGECQINIKNFKPSDSLQIHGMGYKVLTYAVKDLEKENLLFLESLHYQLKAFVVKSIPYDEILKNAAKKLQKRIKTSHPYCRFHGKSQYEKITEYKHTVVEYRKEVGQYFTSGNVRMKNEWDPYYRSYFVPAISNRSFNFVDISNNTLEHLYITTDQDRFDAGNKKIHTLIRTVLLYGPLFFDSKHYEIKPLLTDSIGYVFSFQTKASSYPDKIPITSRGKFTIDYDNQRLVKLEYDYIDYQLYRQVILSKHRKTGSPFSTKATLTFSYDKNENTYIESCLQETQWKADLGDNFILIEQPSRLHPSKGNLIETEAFYCYEYLPIPEYLQNKSVLSKIHLAHRNPIGEYRPFLMSQFPNLLDHRKAFKDLKKELSLEKQFAENSDKGYYPENFSNGFNALSGDEKEVIIYYINIRKARKQLFEWFSFFTSIENN